MASFTADELRVVRSFVGEGETDASLNERFDRLGSMDDAIVESLRYQIAVLSEQPASLSLPGGISIGTGDNLRSLKETLSKFLATGGTDQDPDSGSTTNVTRLSRPQMR